MADAPTLDHADVERIRALLKDPVAVHLNMLHGHIAKIDMRMLAHAHGQEMQDRWAAFERWEATQAPPSPPIAAQAEPDWWRPHASKIEDRVAASGSTEAMACFTDMRTLMQEVARPQPPRPGTAPPDAETVGLIARARLAMKCAVDWEKTREGRPPSQTCLFEIQDAEEWMRTRGIDIGHPTTPTPKDAQ